MKRLFLFILPILVIVAAAFTLFGYFQAEFEEKRLMDDLMRKSKHIAESMELSARNVFLSQDMRSANYIAEKFETRERLQGCVLYDKEGNIVAITKRFIDWKERDKPYIKDLSRTRPRGARWRNSRSIRSTAISCR